MRELGLLLKKNIFKRYFISCSFAYIGINIGLIGINWYIIDFTESNSILANYSIITIFTTIISSVFIGILVDKYNKSVLMKISCIFQALLVCILFYLAKRNENFAIIYGIAVINSLGLALFGTASRSILSDIIEEKTLLIQGNSILEICMQIGAIFAAGVTGILYDQLGINIIICIMAVSLIISSFAMKKTSNSLILCNSNGKKRRLYIDKSNILILGVITFIPYIVTLLSNNVLPGYVNMHLKAPSVVYGISDMLYGIGALAAGFCINIWSKMFRKNKETKMFILSFIVLFVLYMNNSIWIMFIIYFMFGLSNASLKVFMNTLFMERVPTEIYGKCYSLMNSVASIIQMGVLVILGHILDIYGSAIGYVILAVIMLVDGIVLKCYQDNFGR